MICSDDMRSAQQSYVPPELRAVRFSISAARSVCDRFAAALESFAVSGRGTVVSFLTKDAAWLFGRNGVIVQDVARVTAAPRTRCFTTSDHCLHPFDSVTFSNVQPVMREIVRHVTDRDETEVASRSASPSRTVRTPMSAGNPIPCITDITDLNSGQAFLIIDVPGAREFVLKLDSSICDEDGQGGQISAPVNMYKLCAEVVIPRTVVPGLGSKWISSCGLAGSLCSDAGNLVMFATLTLLCPTHQV